MSELRADFMAHAAGLPQPPRTHNPAALLVGVAVLRDLRRRAARAGCHARAGSSPVSDASATSLC